MLEDFLSLLAATVALVIIFTFYNRDRIPKGLRLPPGPRPLPIIGNALDVPKEREWETYDKWAEKYGDLVHLKVFQTHTIIVNSRQMAYELFEKRSSNYADRAEFTMLNKLMGWNWGMPFQRYGDRWRRRRRAFHEKFHSGAVGTFQSSQIKRTRDFLRRLLRAPDDFADHLRHLAGAIIMEITYGIHVKETNDPFLHIAEEAMRGLGTAGVPGAFVVDRIPWLRHLPAWLPGASFKRKARKWYQNTTGMNEIPYQVAKKQVEAGTAEPSFVAAHLDDLAMKNKFTAEEEEIVRDAAGIVFAGGSDTSVLQMMLFMLAMALHPDVQKKAQKELDDVLGGLRLVEFEDEPELPYISAIVKETLRWHTLLPQAVAHAALEDDIVGDYYIPKGSIVVGNSWRLLHSEEDFGPNTDTFMPERFTNKIATRDPELTGAFGYGRRICPGRHMAQNLLFIEIASILQTFQIFGPIGDDGKELPPQYSMSSGFFSHPVDLKLSIRPRSNAAIQLVKETSRSINGS